MQEPLSLMKSLNRAPFVRGTLRVHSASSMMYAAIRGYRKTLYGIRRSSVARIESASSVA